MENAHLWAQPLILMTAFIFFWREAKGSRRELKEYIREELTKVDAKFDRFENEMRKDLGEMDKRVARMEDKVDARFDRLERILLDQGK
ncbi:MAG: hypothetical protein F4014_05440 [Gemmatimonadetes bacterium]|nr:hypothetical protein [Gemmatimonadota bacterium]MYK98255.1 hypothetical protein [Gemmatimonadota bacterium]